MCPAVWQCRVRSILIRAWSGLGRTTWWGQQTRFSIRQKSGPGQEDTFSVTEEAGLYLHWPYCQRRCTYCNFNKYIARDVDHNAMRGCLVRETETLLRLSQVKRISSIFFGGGTPSLARPTTIAAIIDSVAKWAQLPSDAEVTLEINPTSVGASKLSEFRSAGVNRFSIGIQSLHDPDLVILGRDHTSQHALQTLEEAKKLCPGRTSVDIIFGRPGQSVESWEKELEELLLVCCDHVSLYQLTLERGTALFKQVQDGKLSMPSEELTARMYSAARRILGKCGFRQYEVSNFAKNDAVSVHNLAYWKGRQYIGIGPGAHGRFVPRGDGAMLREARIQTLEPDVWMREVQRCGHGTRKRVPLSRLGISEEAMVMGLRMTEGITHEHWKQICSEWSLQEIFTGSQEVEGLLQEGLLIMDSRGVRCSWGGLAVLDSMLPALLNQLQMTASEERQSKQETTF